MLLQPGQLVSPTWCPPGPPIRFSRFDRMNWRESRFAIAEQHRWVAWNARITPVWGRYRYSLWEQAFQP
jgi:hypothetical protein